MKRIRKSQEPRAFKQFATSNPDSSWDDFRAHRGRRSYKEAKELIFQDQQWLCGYCESKVNNSDRRHQRLEHFHSKSDDSNPNKNWTLDWNNIFGVCQGGTIQDTDDNRSWPTPENLSCDAHKDHYIISNNLSPNVEDYLLNPLLLPAFPSLIKFNKHTYELVPDKASCAESDLDSGRFTSVEELVKYSIEDVLNLNCLRLIDKRKEVFLDYLNRISSARIQGNTQILTNLSNQWFKNNRGFCSFFTTRRSLLGSHAEQVLTQINYCG